MHLTPLKKLGTCNTIKRRKESEQRELAFVATSETSMANSNDSERTSESSNGASEFTIIIAIQQIGFRLRAGIHLKIQCIEERKV